MTTFLLRFTYLSQSCAFFWSHLNKTVLSPGKQITFILVSRATAQTAQCPQLQNPAPLVAAAPHHTPRLTLGLTFLTLPSFVTHIPLSVRTRRKHKTTSPRSATPPSIHPHPDATRPSRSWSPKRTTTAQTLLVPWRRWPLRRPWPAAWGAQTPSAQSAPARGPVGRSPTDTFGSVWHRRCRSPAVIRSATQRKTTGARKRTRGNPGEVSEDTPQCAESRSQWLFLHLCLDTASTFGSIQTKKKEQRTILPDTVVAILQRTLRTNKVYFLTGTWGPTVIIAVREWRRAENQRIQFSHMGNFFFEDVSKWVIVALNSIYLWGVWICNYTLLDSCFVDTLWPSCRFHFLKQINTESHHYTTKHHQTIRILINNNNAGSFLQYEWMCKVTNSRISFFMFKIIGCEVKIQQ